MNVADIEAAAKLVNPSRRCRICRATYSSRQHQTVCLGRTPENRTRLTEQQRMERKHRKQVEVDKARTGVEYHQERSAGQPWTVWYGGFVIKFTATKDQAMRALEKAKRGEEART